MSGQPHGGRYVVALDFGTTFSGVAYARKAFPDDVVLILDWPAQKAAAMEYCKTPTALWYMLGERNAWVARAWGWPAVVGYTDELVAAKRKSSGRTESDRPAGYILKRFKLHLSEEGMPEIQGGLPPNVTADRAIADYLRGMAGFVLEDLHKRFGSHVRMKEVEWALTVPAIWGEKAKQKMRNLAREAGMTVEGSPPLSIILEPEAASTYCHHKQAVPLQKNDRILILDAGGGTVDIVVHEKVGEGAEVREVTRSTGGLCGSSFLDDRFFTFLNQRISCLRSFLQQDPGMVVKLTKQWDEIKRAFSGEEDVINFDVPSKLATAWEKTGANEPDFDVIELSLEDMRGIFDPEVNKVISLVKAQLSEAQKCKAILAVGGFSENAYLIKRLKENFKSRAAVEQFVVPPKPGAAICHGALLQILHPEKILSRVARKTYGVACSKLFEDGNPESKRLVLSNGEVRCNDLFSVFVRNGQTVETDSVVKQVLNPVEANGVRMPINVYSTELTSPKFVDEPGVVLEGTFTVDMPDTRLGTERMVEVSMSFGKTCIEVTARGINFEEGENSSKLPVRFES